MSKAAIKLSGLETFKTAMAHKSAALKAELPRCVEEATKAGFETAQEKVPKKTKTLHDSIKMTVNGLEGKVESNCRYASFVEFGTKAHGPEQPYIRPGQKAANKKLISEVNKVVAKK